MHLLKFQVNGLKSENEHALKELLFSISGVREVEINAQKSLARILVDEGVSESTIEQRLKGTAFSLESVTAEACDSCGVKKERPSFLVFLTLLGLVYFIGQVFSRLGILENGFSFSSQTTFVTAFFVGLVAASSACVAVSGGVMLSVMNSWAITRQNASRMQRLIPIMLFVVGRLISYGLLGALIGAIGTSLVMPSWVLGTITILAAFYMMIAGLDMLGFTPVFVKKILPRMPSFLNLNANASSTNLLAPLMLGAGTFFLPCGFTQSLQLYALTTGSAMRSGMLLFAFAFGTAPSLILIGMAAGSVKGKTARLFHHFAGTAVLLLGIITVQNGLTASGIVLPKFEWQSAAVASSSDANVTFDGNEQVIRVKLGYDPAYTPSNHFTVKEGIPVRMEIEGEGTGCREIFQIPKFGVRTALNSPVNTIRFIPTQTGSAVFSCSMGMFPGTINVIKG